MSQYLNIYVKNGDNCIEIANLLRGTPIYSIFANKVPYGKVRKIDKSELFDVVVSLEDSVRSYKDTRDGLEQRRNEIASWNNTVEEKLAVIAEIDEDIEAVNEEIERVEYNMYLARFLNGMRYLEEPPEIYMGIEAQFIIDGEDKPQDEYIDASFDTVDDDY